jgi:hypothetical protein
MRDVQLWRVTETPDDRGGVSRSWSLVGTLPMTVTQPAEQEQTVGLREGVDGGYVLTWLLGADVRRGDRVVTYIGATIEVRTIDRDDRAGDAGTVTGSGRDDPHDDQIPE